MAERRRRFEPEFREGAVRIVRETGKPVAQVARDLGINAGTLGNWVNRDRVERGEKEGLGVDERARLAQLEREVAVGFPRLGGHGENGREGAQGAGWVRGDGSARSSNATRLSWCGRQESRSPRWHAISGSGSRVWVIG